jgi:hypothetical protein
MSTEWAAAQWEDSETPAPAPTALALVASEPDVIEPETALDETKLDDLAELANEWHAAAQDSARNALKCAWYAGDVLLKAKSQCGHGEWLPWLADNFDGSERTAQGYMKLRAKAQRVADLDPDQSLRDALKALSKTKREPTEPVVTMKSFLRRLAALGEDAKLLAPHMSGYAADDADNMAEEMLGPMGAIDELYDRLQSHIERKPRR